MQANLIFRKPSFRQIRPRRALRGAISGSLGDVARISYLLKTLTLLYTIDKTKKKKRANCKLSCLKLCVFFC